jgi:hypothetical protein
MNGFSAGCHLAILAILCTLAIFLFPAVRGPFSATHGPATSLEVTRAWQWLCLLFVLIPLLRLAGMTTRPAAGFDRALSGPACPHEPPLEELSVLRC